MSAPVLPSLRLRQLPRTIEPLHRETSGSYLGRLAAANRLSHQELSAHDLDRIHPGKLTTLHAIHCLSGHAVDRLLRALPDLRTAEMTARFTTQRLKPLPDKGWTTQPVCTRCLAGLGITTHASHHVPISTNICLRHGRWIGRYGHQLELHTVPEVIRAQRHHYNLVRRHGQRIVTYAMAEATDISFRWWDSNRFDRRWRRRMTELSGPKWRAFKDDIELVACTYPEIVALRSLRLAASAVPALHGQGTRPAAVHQGSPRPGRHRLQPRRRQQTRPADPLDRGRTLRPRPPLLSLAPFEPSRPWAGERPMTTVPSLRRTPSAPAVVGYARTAAGQSPVPQINTLMQAGVAEESIYIEHTNGHKSI
ncbi:TniQ family protein [Streptomyces sp. NPDC051956]|uniref:TniQ family protein n=1 Tax=Streptomyces sp. NPDC051956 TaxID=3365677 RepID=UPI0037D3C29E